MLEGTLQTHHLLLSNLYFPHPLALPPIFPQFTYFISRSAAIHHYVSVSAHSRRAALLEPLLAEVPNEPTTDTTSPAAPTEEGPIELPSAPTIFATSDDPTPLQTATSLLLTGAISVFLFRSLRRRAKRAKELKYRSSGVKKSLKEEALESLKSITPAPVDADKPPSPVQALLGGLTAGVVALILYKFTTTIEAALNRQAVSDSFSVRQITITIRTIVNGLCYLATFVFGINSVGLLLYSGQLAINSMMGDSSDEESQSDKGQLKSPNPTSLGSSDSSSVISTEKGQNEEIDTK